MLGNKHSFSFNIIADRGDECFMEKIFLSHSSADKPFVETIAKKFGKDVCVYDKMCFEAGMKNLDEIFKGLDRAGIFVLFISDASLRSEWIQREIAAAEERLNHDDSKLSQIFPIIIDASICHDDLRIPDFLKKGTTSYNLRPILRAPVAYRKIKAQMINRLLQGDLQFSTSYGFFYGRDKEIGAFKTCFDGLNSLRVMIAAGIPGIGRCSYLIQALRNAEIIERYYEPVIISLGSMDSIEDLLAKLYEAGFGDYTFEEVVAMPTMESKIDALTNAFQSIQNFKEHIIIYDDGCLVNYSGELKYWFEQAITAETIRPELTISLASRHGISYMYERRNSWIFSIELSTLPYPEWNGLLRTYSKKIGVELSQEEREYFKDVITGYPPQVIYCADLAKEMGIEYVKKNTYQLVSNVAGNATRILETAITGENTESGYGLLSFMSTYGLIPVSILHKIFEIKPIYQELFHHFRSLTICRYIGSAREYVEVNPVIGDYIQRNNYELPQDIRKILSQELDCFSEKLVCNPDIADEEDFESLRFYLKEALKDGQEIPQRFLYSTIYLQSIFELYNSQKYVQVIEIVSALKENGAFNRYDQDVQLRIQGYYCRALARERDETFYGEVEFFRSCGETKKHTVEYHFLRGFMYRNCGNFPKAKEQYLNVLRQSPNHRSAKRELVAVYTGLEDYESAYEYAKENYEKESENVYYIQSYFEVMIHMPNAIMQEHMAQIEEMVETIGRINKNKPTDFYYQINALYSAYIEKDEERTLGLLAEGAKRFSHSLYIAKTRFDCCDFFGNIGGMEQALKALERLWDKGRVANAGYEIRVVIMSAYHKKPEAFLHTKIDSITGITQDAKNRLKNKVSSILRTSR